MNEGVCKEAVRNSISGEMASVDKAIDQLGGSFDELAAKLSGLLTPSTDSGEGCAPQVANPQSDVLSQVVTQRERINAITSRIAIVKDRLEI